MGAFSLHIVMYTINLFTCAHLRLATELLCLWLTLETASLSSGFFVYHRYILFACAATNQSIIALRTTGVEDTYRTLTVFPLQVGVKNSLKYFAITNIREKNC